MFFFPDEIGHNLFALDLRYENPTTGGTIGTDANFNGNISQMHWNSKNDIQRAYGFRYDPLNRLTSAGYGDGAGGSNHPNHFSTTFEYDANGNITDLQRHKDNILIDNLIYAFYSNGNRLQSVEDVSGNSAGYMPNTGQYLYDANANMTYDPSRKITVSYNQLNLPRLVEFDIDLSPDNRRETTILLTPTPPPASNSAKPSWRDFAIRVHKNQDFNSRVLISY